MEELPMHHRPVAVAIGGFLCAGRDIGGRKYSFWGIPAAALEKQGFRVITVDPSPVGSLHDRACQIFYELKGGTVFYGQEHSRSHGHACHGETYAAGLFPEWGGDNPIHVIGHSYGGQTARVLQHLLSTGFFSKPGEYDTSATWVRTVTACNSPLNGSLLVYSLGERAEAAPAVRVGSHGHLLSVALHAVELLDLAWLRRIFNPRLSHFELSRRTLGWRLAWLELFRAMVGESAIFSRPDNAAYDMTVHSAHQWNQEIHTDPNTFYFSLVGTRPELPSKRDRFAEGAVACCRGVRCWIPGLSRSLPRKCPEEAGLRGRGLPTRLIYWMLQRLHVWQVGAHEREVETRFGVGAGAWSSAGHDGVLEAYTQSHPRVPQECEARVSAGLPECASALKPGVWHVLPVLADHMWAHADEAYVQDTFERLARSLRMAAAAAPPGPPSGPPLGSPSDLSTAAPAVSVPPPPRETLHRCFAVRRSPRLLAKAQRRAVVPAAAAATVAAPWSHTWAGAEAGTETRSYRAAQALRFDLCAARGAEGIGARGPGAEADFAASSREGGGMPAGGKIPPFRRLIFRALVLMVALLATVLGAVLYSSVIATPERSSSAGCESGRVAHGPCSSAACLVIVDTVAPVGIFNGSDPSSTGGVVGAEQPVIW